MRDFRFFCFLYFFPQLGRERGDVTYLHAPIRFEQHLNQNVICQSNLMKPHPQLISVELLVNSKLLFSKL